MNKPNKPIMINKVINFKNKDFDVNHSLFWVQDAYAYAHEIFDEITYCDHLFVPKQHRRKGIASKRLQDYIKENIGNEKLYFIQAGFSKDEYTEEEFENATAEERDELFDKLDKFYTKNGFFNINTLIGSYENSMMYLYANDVAIRLLEKIISYKDFKLVSTDIFDSDLEDGINISIELKHTIYTITINKIVNHKLEKNVYTYNMIKD